MIEIEKKRGETYLLELWKKWSETSKKGATAKNQKSNLQRYKDKIKFNGGMIIGELYMMRES